MDNLLQPLNRRFGNQIKTQAYSFLGGIIQRNTVKYFLRIK